MIGNENLEISVYNKIPSSNEDYFIFENIGDFSILIKFDFDNVNIENLYCVIQSYLWNKEIRSLKIYTGFVNINKKKILSYSNIFIVKKMNLIYFNEGGENIYNHDKIYINEDEKELYGIIICFSKISVMNYFKNKNLKIDQIKYIKPIYPGKKEIENHLLFFK